MTYTQRQQQIDSYVFQEFKDEYRDRKRQGQKRECEFRGKWYPSVGAAVRAVGHSRDWMVRRGLVIARGERK